MRPNYKQLLPYAGAVLLFVLLSFAYFLPDIAEGKVLFQGDVQQGVAVGQEAKAFRESTGETTRWTNSLFGGMPTYQISPSYGPSAVVRFLDALYGLFLPTPVSLVFSMMLGFFILLVALRTKWYLAALGAVAYAFSSYFFILIEAGHIWKFVTLTYIPPTIAGVLLAYRGNYLGGGALAALFGTLQLAANHFQMTYYFLFVIAALVIALFIEKQREGKLAVFWKATGSLAVAALVALAANLPALYHTYEYSKETIRGASELKAEESVDAQRHRGGLEKEYIVQWSYGLGESWSLLIPDVKGGGTGYLGQEPARLADVSPDYKPYIAQMNRYWGDQPFTSGPVYVGAFVLALFVLGCFLVKGPVKWALLGVTLLSLLLSWGKNFMPLSDLFIDYFPLYNKFRTVSSILVIAEFCIPLLAILTLKQLLERPGLLREKRNETLAAFLLTGGFALLFALLPDFFFSFLSQGESQAYGAQAAGNPQVAELLAQLESVRRSIFTADAWRSFAIVTAGFALLLLYDNRKLNRGVLVTLVSLLVVGDLYSADKRYLNSRNFVQPQERREPFPATEADRQILQDPDPNYRVLNTTTSTFNDAVTSYRHKSIGGYHAAKLRRYQDLIDHQIAKGNPRVLDMLNTRYIIVADEQGTPQVQYNPNAAGNGWFVSRIEWVKNGREEMTGLDDFDPRTTAFVDESFRSDLPAEAAAPRETAGDTIRLVSYRPNELAYETVSGTGGFAVFSEIYYPHGWKATIDGQAVPIVRTDYLLRGLYVPAGTHTVRFVFDPASVPVTEAAAYGAFALIFAGLLGWGILFYRKKQD